jgi:NADP-dependent 3-hydroxy acid dehydrogenase YdfG
MSARFPTGKVAVVTGASGGLGLRICEAFVREGMAVAMLSRSAPSLGAAAGEIGAAATAFPTDIADPVQVRSTFAAITQRLGGVDVLVNNAAVGFLQSIEESEDLLLHQEVGTNLLGSIYCMRSAIPLMRARGGGHIVNITSESSRMPYPFLSVYAATKAALETLSTGLRSELRGENIRVSVLRSGRMTESGFNRHWPEDRRAKYHERVTAQGHYAQSGEPISPHIAAQAIADLIRMPANANVDFLELRPA